MIYCTQCGRPSPAEGRYCTACGARLVAGGRATARLSRLGARAGEEYLVGEMERTIGRDPDSDIAIPDEEMSALHARLVRRSDGFWIEDLGSTNGTFVNGERVAGAARVRSNDLLKLGQTLLRVEMQ